MKKTSVALAAGSVLGAGLLLKAWLAAPLTKNVNGYARFMPGGRLKLSLMRTLVTAGAAYSQSRSDRPKEAVRAMEQKLVPTSYGETPVTFYWPITASTEPLPVLVNLHGGGFILGWPGQDDLLCRYFAQHAGCVVVNVDYVRAPQHTFPVPAYQCYEVVRWVAEQAAALGYDASRLAISGHSAGASLAAAVTLLAKERQEFTLATQILDYPLTNLLEPVNAKSFLPERSQMLSPAALQTIVDLYTPNARDRANPLASPALAPDLTGLPPTLIITAEYDSLLFDGATYAERLRQQGVTVTYQEFKGVDHGFTHAGPKAPAVQAWDLMVQALQQAFHTQPG